MKPGKILGWCSHGTFNAFLQTSSSCFWALWRRLAELEERCGGRGALEGQRMWSLVSSLLADIPECYLKVTDLLSGSLPPTLQLTWKEKSSCPDAFNCPVLGASKMPFLGFCHHCEITANNSCSDFLQIDTPSPAHRALMALPVRKFTSLACFIYLTKGPLCHCSTPSPNSQVTNKNMEKDSFFFA